MNLTNIQPIAEGLLNVIIETPRNSQNKFDYDPELDLFRLKKTLPMGTVFPFDFGFIPNTIAEDGDPMDVLVIMEQHAYPGCLIQCRPIGILEAIQKEKDNKKERNDRVVAVSASSILYSDITDVKELNKHMVREIENFFTRRKKIQADQVVREKRSVENDQKKHHHATRLRRGHTLKKGKFFQKINLYRPSIISNSFSTSCKVQDATLFASEFSRQDFVGS